MNQYEVPALIADKLPEVRDAVINQVTWGSADNALFVLAGYTQRMCMLHDLPAIQKCMKLADRIYTRGNTAVKAAVTNIFVASFSNFKDSCNKVEWRFLQARMPIHLYSLYIQELVNHKSTLSPSVADR